MKGSLTFFPGFVALLLMGGFRAFPSRPANPLPSPGSHLQIPATARVYEAPRAIAPPLLDGRIQDSAWEQAPWSSDFMDIRGPTYPTPRFRTRVKILWDEAALYIAAELEEPHLWATLHKRDAIIYQDHDFEVFLDPNGKGMNYFEVEINALGTILDLFLNRPYRDGGRPAIGWDASGLGSAVYLDGTLNEAGDRDVGWSVEMAIPWRSLVAPGSSPPPPTSTESGGQAPSPPAPPRPGEEWRVNFSRVEWPIEVVEDPMEEYQQYQKVLRSSSDIRHPEDNWVWSPQGVINMHIPAYWGVLRFVDRVFSGGGR